MNRNNNKTLKLTLWAISWTYIPVLALLTFRGSRRPSIAQSVSLSVLLLCYFTSSVFALTAVDEIRYTNLTKEIRCVVCQNQNIADSDAPLANDLRKKIYSMVEENKSDNEIKDYLVARYGDFILLKPRFNALTFVLWLFPFTSLIVVLWLVVRNYSSAGHRKNAK